LSQSSIPVGAGTVEEVVRAQLAKALGGRRGMLEAAVPTLTFTVVFLTTKDLRLAVTISVGAALVLLAVRALQRGTVQFVVNSLVGIGLGAFFAWRSARGGGSADEQALAYFLPGLIYNGGYASLMALSNVVRWPLVGFMVGSVAGDPTEWHRDPQVVSLCRNLTWMLAAPCLARLVVQLPIYLAGKAADDPTGMIAALGITKVVMGWPLQILGLAGMAWLLARNRTPVSPGP
jgi:Protein of unknown function (DUF3159)